MEIASVGSHICMVSSHVGRIRRNKKYVLVEISVALLEEVCHWVSSEVSKAHSRL